MTNEPEQPKELKFDNVSPEVEKDLEDMIYQNCLKFALFERKWKREQREKKRQEQEKTS
jgi:hypothetical protein